MNGVKFIGRLGNQLFQFSFGYNVSKIRGVTLFYIFYKIGVNKTDIHKYFNLPNFNIFNNSLLKYIYYLKYKPRSQEIVNDFEFEEYNILPNTIIGGYFQSEKYFIESRNELKSNIKVKKVYQKLFNHKYKNLYSNNRVVAIHIRLTDYVDHGNDSLGGKDLTLPFSYYKKVIDSITPLESYKLIFISDNINEVMKYFGCYANTYFENNSAIIDFQIIQNADICILSNSTFAWWAAYLSNKEKPIVYAPKYWLGFKVKKEYPAGIMSVNYNWIDV